MYCLYSHGAENNRSDHQPSRIARNNFGHLPRSPPPSLNVAREASPLIRPPSVRRMTAAATRDTAEVWAPAQNGLSSFVAHTAMLVAAERLADARHAQPVLRDHLLEKMLEHESDAQAAVETCVNNWERQKHEYGLEHVAPFTSVRMRFGDEEVMRYLTVTPGRLQIVILGAGLDTRAWRLELGERVSIYEVDQPDMSTAKGHCLRAGNAQTSRAQTGSCQFPLKCGSWIAVAADLTQDWKTALQDKGFDKGLPTLWIAEGLVYYLEMGVCARLLQGMAALAAPGSALIMTHLSWAFYQASQKALQDPAVSVGAKQWFGSWKSWLPQEPGVYFETNGWRMQSLSTLSDAFTKYGVSQSKDMEKLLKPFTSQAGPPDYCCVSAKLLQDSLHKLS